MIYYVTAQQQAFEVEEYQLCTVEESIKMINSFTEHMVQLDTETTGLDPHIDKCLLLQFGNIEETIQIVVDATTINIKVYDEVIQKSFIIGQNLKFDEKVLYANNLMFRNCYDTMTAEQVLYQGTRTEYRARFFKILHQ